VAGTHQVCSAIALAAVSGAVAKCEADRRTAASEEARVRCATLLVRAAELGRLTGAVGRALSGTSAGQQGIGLRKAALAKRLEVAAASGGLAASLRVEDARARCATVLASSLDDGRLTDALSVAFRPPRSDADSQPQASLTEVARRSCAAALADASRDGELQAAMLRSSGSSRLSGRMAAAANLARSAGSGQLAAALTKAQAEAESEAVPALRMSIFDLLVSKAHSGELRQSLQELTAANPVDARRPEHAGAGAGGGGGVPLTSTQAGSVAVAPPPLRPRPPQQPRILSRPVRSALLKSVEAAEGASGGATGVVALLRASISAHLLQEQVRATEAALADETTEETRLRSLLGQAQTESKQAVDSEARLRIDLAEADAARDRLEGELRQKERDVEDLYQMRRHAAIDVELAAGRFQPKLPPFMGVARHPDSQFAELIPTPPAPLKQRQVFAPVASLAQADGLAAAAVVAGSMRRGEWNPPLSYLSALRSWR